MAEYIKRDEYIKREAVCAACNDGKKARLCHVDCILHEVPAADVVSGAVFEQVMWERGMAMKQLQEHGIPFGGKADVVAVGNCEGCLYSHRKRPQKCSCCRRNPDMKDCYEEG